MLTVDKLNCDLETMHRPEIYLLVLRLIGDGQFLLQPSTRQMIHNPLKRTLVLKAGMRIRHFFHGSGSAGKKFRIRP